MLRLRRDQIGDEKRLVRDLTREITQYGKKKRKIVKFYAFEGRSWVWLPRFYAIRRNFDVAVDTDLPLHQPGLTLNGQLLKTKRRPQVRVFEAAIHALNKRGGTIITLPCGAGKTNVGIALCVYYGVKTLVLCHNMTLMNQWKQRLETFVKGGIRVGRIQQNVCDTQDKDVVLASLQSLHARNYPEEALRYGMVIVDEAHHIVAQTFAWALKKLTFKYSIGLTATLERRDKLEDMVCLLIGQPCTYLVKPGELEPTGRLCLAIDARPDVQVNVVHFRRGKQRVRTNRRGDVQYSTMVTWLTQDAERNRLLLQLVSMMRQDGRQGLLLSDRVDHLRYLHEHIPDSEIFTGKLKTEKQQDAAAEKEFKKFMTLSTYRQFAEAMDFCGNFIILATPVSAVEQPVGRILRDRLVYWKHVRCQAIQDLLLDAQLPAPVVTDYLFQCLRPVIIDFFDVFSIFAGMANKRLKYYTKAGFELIHVRDL
uniref:Helicase ATP-binding domain-containing protein n=1 Tax=viral metagenome TaxID=1070528 RepID=A0A6C0BPH0_9ZZZZ